VYENGAPSYLRTHPLTFERIADIQSRIQGVPFRQIADSLEFQLVRARLSAQDGNAREAAANFDRTLEEHKFGTEAAARYGLVVALLRVGDKVRARTEMAMLLGLKAKSPMIDALAAQTLISGGEVEKGLATYRDSLRANPSRRALIYGYADALIAANKAADAIQFLNDRVDGRPTDPQLYEFQARAYTAMGKRLLQHRALAEVYALRGNLPAAIEQLQIAQKAGDGDFYQKSSVEARLKELMAADTENRRKP
jgi:predicted Zn-dependent protease